MALHWLRRAAQALFLGGRTSGQRQFLDGSEGGLGDAPFFGSDSREPLGAQEGVSLGRRPEGNVLQASWDVFGPEGEVRCAPSSALF